jgi:hypothetical protein
MITEYERIQELEQELEMAYREINDLRERLALKRFDSVRLLETRNASTQTDPSGELNRAREELNQVLLALKRWKKH